MPGRRRTLGGNISRNAIAAALVILLHLVAFTFFQVRQRNFPAESAPAETIITLAPARVARAPSSAAPAPPSTHLFTPPPDWSPPPDDLSQLHFALNGCISDINDLSAPERARCRAMGLNDYGDVQRGPVIAEKSRSKYAAKWEAAIAERNKPFHIPCTYVAPSSDGGSAAIGVDFICAGFAALRYLQEESH